jgi:hypothetical protein
MVVAGELAKPFFLSAFYHLMKMKKWCHESVTGMDS